MGSGGIHGRPLVFDGTAGNFGQAPINTADPLQLPLLSQLSGRATFARSLRVSNTSAEGINVFVNDQPAIRVAAGAEIFREMLVHRLAIRSQSGNAADFEAVAVLAA